MVDKDASCNFCHLEDSLDRIIYDVSMYRKGGKWRNAFICDVCITELRKQGVQFKIFSSTDSI
jgi:superfamily II helicase